MTGIQEFKPDGAEPYPVGGFDCLLDALRTWRLDANKGIVGVPTDRDVSGMLTEAGYDLSRALDVTAGVFANYVTIIDKAKA